MTTTTIDSAALRSVRRRRIRQEWGRPWLYLPLTGLLLLMVTPFLWMLSGASADVVVSSMGCGDACPVFSGKRYLDRTLDNPAGRTVDDVRPVRDDIERRVRGLLDDLGVPAQD